MEARVRDSGRVQEATYDPKTNTLRWPDGKVEVLPPCGNGDFALTTTKRYDYPDGTSRTRSYAVTGHYAWGYVHVGAQPNDTFPLVGDQGQVTLMDAPMRGVFTHSDTLTILSLETPYLGYPPPDLPTYQFTSDRR